MAIAEQVVLQDGISGPAANATASILKLSQAVKGLNGASAGAAAAEAAQIKANAQLRLVQEKAVAAAALSQQKAIQQAILSSQKASHAIAMANIKAEGAAKAAAIKKEAAEQKKVLTEEEKVAKKIAEFDADKYRSLVKQKDLLKQMQQQALGPKEKPSADVAGALGDAMGGGGQIGGVLQKLGMAAGAAGVVGAVIGAEIAAATKVYEMVDAAYQKAVSVITGLGAAGIRMAIDATSAHDELVGIFESMGRSQETSERLYTKVAAIAIQTGRSKEVLAGEFKRLAALGFKDKELPVLVKMLGDIGAVRGEGKANAMEKLLQRVQAKGSLDKGTAQAFVKQGYSQEKFYAELAKELNKKPADIAALLKQGKINAAVAERAMDKVVESQIGGAAAAKANTVLSLLDRIKTAVEELFVLDAKAQAPVKSFLQNILKAFETDGMQLKSAVNDLFGAIFGTALGELSGNKGKATVADFFRQITVGVHQAAAAIRSLRPEVMALVAMFKQMMHDGTIKSLVEVARMTAKAKMTGLRDEAHETKAKAKLASDPIESAKDFLLNPFRKIADLTGHGGKLDDLESGLRKKLFGDENKTLTDTVAAKSATKKVTLNPPMLTGIPDSVTADMKANMLDSGADIGGMLNEGMAQGIENSMDRALDAGGASAQAIIAHVKAILGIHSPSEVFRTIGDFTGEGMVVGLQGSANRVAAAAGKLAGHAIAGASGGTGAYVPAAGGAANNNAGGGAGGGVTINGGIHVIVQGHAGGKADEQGDEIARAIDKGIRDYMRRRAA